MKIVFVSEINPFPPLGGDSIRPFNLLKALQSFASVHLVVLDCEGVYKNQFSELSKDSGVESITYINKTKTAGSGLIERLRPRQKVLDELAEIANQVQPDIVFLEYGYIAHYYQAFPGCKVIFDTQNIQSEIDRQLAILPSSKLCKKIYANLVWKASEYHERKYLPACHAVVAVSSQDREYYKNFVDPNTLWVIPNFIDISKYKSPDILRTSQNPNIVFTGSMDAFQNQMAGDYLLEKIWSKIAEKIPNCELFIVGKNPPQRWLEISDPRIHVTGQVASTIPYLKSADVAIVPVLHGSGTRYKILEAMACGVPVVSTPLGCQGLDVQNGIDILIEEAADKLAERTIELFKSPQKRASITARGYYLVEQEYSLEANKAKLQNLCNRLLGIKNEDSILSKA